jgi:hypothetical protein
MQATIPTRRFDSRQIKQAALAIAILTSTAIGVTTAILVRDAADTDAGRTAVVTSALTNREQAFGFQFMEMNLDLPTGGAASVVNRSTDYQFIEQNLHLPASDLVPATISVDAMRFQEMNMDLPSSTTTTAADWQVLEANSWGQDFVLDGSDGSLPPSADDVQQGRLGQVVY